MLNLSAPIRRFVGKSRGSTADSVLFQLHYILTTGILLTFTLIYCTKDLVGDPIRCVLPSKTGEDIRKLAETFCYIKSLYTLNNDRLATAYEKPLSYREIYPGVGPLQYSKYQTKIRHSYYIWSSFFCLFLALLFYAPRFLWKRLECGSIANFAGRLNKVITDRDTREAELEELSQHFQRRLGHFNNYTVRFLICEGANVIVTFISIIITDVYLDHRFVDYGIKVLNDIHYGKFDEFDTPKTMSTCFPTVAKCDWKQYGDSGSTVVIDVLCILPLNNVNDKVFLFLWFHFLILGFVSLLWIVVWRIVPITSFRVRRFLLMRAVGKLKSQKERNVSNLVKLLSVSDWFVLFELRKNIDWVYYGDFVVDIANERDFEIKNL